MADHHLAAKSIRRHACIVNSDTTVFALRPRFTTATGMRKRASNGCANRCSLLNNIDSKLFSVCAFKAWKKQMLSALAVAGGILLKAGWRNRRAVASLPNASDATELRWRACHKPERRRKWVTCNCRYLVAMHV